MHCPFCEAKTKIYNSRSSHSGTQTWRRHRCNSCQRVFTTRERIDWDTRTSIITATDQADYSRERLLLSVVRASQNLVLPSGMITELVDSIEHRLQKQLIFEQSVADSQAVVAIATTVLRRYDPNLALQYINGVYRSNPPLELVKQLLAG